MQDGLDNDADGWTDVADLGCWRRIRRKRRHRIRSIAECNDGIDNDGDNDIDAFDVTATRGDDTKPPTAKTASTTTRRVV